VAGEDGPRGRESRLVLPWSSVGLYEAATGRRRRTLPTVDGWLTPTFTRDGRRLVTASSDGTALVWDVYARRGAAGAGRAWDDLASADAGRAFDAVCDLVADPEAAVALLRERLRPARLDRGAIRRWLTDLGSDDFTEREAATRALSDLGGDV